jgi:transcriptional regulator with XRE-family HTH domain
MAVPGGQLAGTDQNIAVNLRACREAGSVSQEELARRMAARGFGFRQATVWKIESGQRPVRASELVALADCLQLPSVMGLAGEPGTAAHTARLRQAGRAARDAYQALKEAAAAYLQAQDEILAAARDARDDGAAVTEPDTSWLAIPAEQAVIEARVQADQEYARTRHLDSEVTKVVNALRAAGYEPALRLDGAPATGSPPGIWATAHPDAPTQPGRQA